MYPFATQFGSTVDYLFSEIFSVWVLTHMRVRLGWSLIRVGRTLRRLGLRAGHCGGGDLPLDRNRAVDAAPSWITNTRVDVATFLKIFPLHFNFLFSMSYPVGTTLFQPSATWRSILRTFGISHHMADVLACLVHANLAFAALGPIPYQAQVRHPCVFIHPASHYLTLHVFVL